MKQNFSRSNVNESTLQITDPMRSSFDLSHTRETTVKLGRFTPVNFERLMPTDVVQGSISPQLQLEKIVTPSIGKTRLDTHTFAVHARRVNKDYRQFSESDSGSLPVFTYSVIDQFLTALFAARGVPTSGFSADVRGLMRYIQYSSGINTDSSKKLYFETNNDGVLVDILPIYRCIDIILSYLEDVSFDLSNQVFGECPYFTTDFWALYHERIYQYRNSVVAPILREDAYRVSAPWSGRESGTEDVADIRRALANNIMPILSPWFDMLLYIIEPLFGQGSLLDCLGYPVYTKYSSFYQLWDTPQGKAWLQNVASAIVPSLTDHSVGIALLSDFGMYHNSDGVLSSNFNKFFAILFDINAIIGTTNLGVVTSVPVADGSPLNVMCQYSEMPFRVAYAAWYDYMRDWHVEPREKILDPDNFGASSLLPAKISSSDAAFTTNIATAAGMEELARIILLLDLRYRNFSRDFLTTVQTDDPFRHVYNPILLNADDAKDGSVETTGYRNSQTTAEYDEIDKILVSSVLNDDGGYYNFPTNPILPNSRAYTHTFDVLRSDLQTMRRAGMLEKWLARNYYFPDTYVGRLQARFGIKPSDANVLVSEYLGGSETFIAGDQLKNPTGTDQMPAGTRTMVAGAGSSDSFTYRATDYCYLISFVSIVPLVSYDMKNPAIHEIRRIDVPSPEFGTDARVEFRTFDFLRGFRYGNPIGYVPRYYSYRVRGNEVCGRYLTDYRSYCWFRDWLNMTFGSDATGAKDFMLTPYHLRVHLPLDAFLGLYEWDDIAFGTISIGMQVNRALPAAVEFI